MSYKNTQIIQHALTPCLLITSHSRGIGYVLQYVEKKKCYKALCKQSIIYEFIFVIYFIIHLMFHIIPNDTNIIPKFTNLMVYL